MKTKTTIYLALAGLAGLSINSFADNSTTPAGITEPQLLSKNLPQYPETARSLGLEGTVVVECLIDEQGNVFGAEVIHSIHPLLDEATLATVNDWNFKPAELDGKATIRVVQIPIKYNLLPAAGKNVFISDTKMIAAK